ncbi:uncharacterized protein LOC112692175 [Sipha flava]|uniref:Uncharacterized protein LOC112692175 n=2 Tax=Sipha flava TaxID=143950 RepID=A0A8B8GIW6_9HEMI|nr:uncharacterized protein LOC112692175 [Sipha flava]
MSAVHRHTNTGAESLSLIERNPNSDPSQSTARDDRPDCATGAEPLPAAATVPGTVPERTTDINSNVFDRGGRKPTTTGNTTTCCCLICCYAAVPSADDPITVGHHTKTAPKRIVTTTTAADNTDICEPPSEAAAFIASASAAVLVLMAALLAVVLSFTAVLTVTSLVPVADAAADFPGHQQRAADHLHRWHQQQQQPSPPTADDRWDVEQRPRQPHNEEHSTSRPKRQLWRKNADREPGVVALTFSLIGGTVSDARQAYRNVTNIVRDTISEVAAIQQQPANNDGDQMMMAAGNTVENETGASSAAPPVDQRVAGQTLGKLLGRNYRGLRRLFNSELRSAIKNSPGNVRDFAFELMGSIGQSFRPSNIFTRGPVNGESTNSTKR